MERQQSFTLGTIAATTTAASVVTKPALMTLILLGIFATTTTSVLAATIQVNAQSAEVQEVASTMTAATIRKIDLAQGKITLKHAAIVNIGMPAMTMVFKVAGPALLNGFAVDDQVLVAVEKQGSALVVTAITKQVPAATE